MMHGSLIISFLLLLNNIASGFGGITCKNQQGQPVDWFVVYKLPKLKHHVDNPDVNEGLGFYYMDADSQKWTLGGNINNTGNAVQATLQQIYDNRASSDVMYLVYNDETPVKQVSYSHGHTKGALAFDKTSGYWLVHSVPRFPPYVNSSYGYPESGTHYGQTFLCVSYEYTVLNTIGEQLKLNYPQIYDHNLPTQFAEENKAIADVVKNIKTCSSEDNHAVVDLTSLGSNVFMSFAKCGDFNADLYHDLVAPTYQSDLYVESWLLGTGKLPSDCSGNYKVNNIQYLKFDASQGLEFKSTEDHSKWTVSQNFSLTCIGDINREKSQMHRCGGTVCMGKAFPSMWNMFKSLITRVENCSTYQ